MPGIFYVTGLVIPSNTGRSFKVYTLDDKGNKVFVGIVSQKALSLLIQKRIPQADICQFSQTATQEPFSFLELKP